MFTPDSIAPRQRLMQLHRRGVRRIDRVRIPLYGLPVGWPGVRTTGNTSFETGVTRDVDGRTVEMFETIELVHEQGPSRLIVESTDHPATIEDAELLRLLGRTGTCEPLTISLDGKPVAFASARCADVFVARWVGYEATVTVRAEQWPTAFGLQLVRVEDLSSYHEGRLRLLESRSGLDLRD